MKRFSSEGMAAVERVKPSCAYSWTKVETCKFIEGLGRYRGDWQKISEYVGTKSVIEVFHYWFYCFQGLNEQLKEEFFENIFLEERKQSLDSEEEENLSFFAQKIAPMLECGYDGLFSLVEGFSQHNNSNHTREHQPHHTNP